jgi:hypothetical protein
LISPAIDAKKDTLAGALVITLVFSLNPAPIMVPIAWMDLVWLTTD